MRREGVGQKKFCVVCDSEVVGLNPGEDETLYV